MRMLAVLLFLLSFAPSVGAKDKILYDLTSLYNEKKVTILHRKVTVGIEAGKQILTMNEETDEGLVWLNDVSFSTGVIEIDLKGQDVYQHSFVGIAFHGADDSTFEAVYFRPFQFRTEDTVRRNRGVQYISLPKQTWQVLREQHPGKYEQPVLPAPDPNNWFHMKLVVTHNDVSVYVNNAATPCLHVKALGGRKEGKIGLYTADRSGGTFANLSITKNPRLPLK